MFVSKITEGFNSYGRMKLILIIGVVAFVFAKNFVTDIGQAFGGTVTATITDRVENCRVVVRTPNRTQSYQKLPCGEAYAMRRADESGKTRVYKKKYVVLTYPLKSGRLHKARVREHKVRARRLPIGSEIQISYNPRNPNKVKLAKSWWKISKSALWFVFGLLVLSVAMFGYQKLQSLFDQFKKSMERTAHEAQSRRGRADILARLEENFGAETAEAVLGPSSVSVPSPPPPRKPRVSQPRKKTAPIPKTGGVVSKRRRGLFS